MATTSRTMTGKARTFPPDELIVSKTDKTGRITYVNDVFITVSGYSESEVLGQQHSIVRHPETPRCLLKLLWDTVSDGREIFVYPNNRAKNGDHYWVFAHVTPDLGPTGEVTGYHSNRRVPRQEAIDRLLPLYGDLLAEERRHEDSKEGLAASSRLLNATLEREGKCYDEFILGL